MVDLVRVFAQVRNDVQHQLVVRLLAAMKEVNLLLQQRKELVEIDVLRVPGGDRVRHGRFPVLP